MRLHARVPAVQLVAARLGDPGHEVADRVALLETAGCAEVAASLEALKGTLQRIVRAALRGTPSAAPARAAGLRGS
jgi:hypothetical protein